MKKLLFLAVLSFNFCSHALPDIKKIFATSEAITVDEQVRQAIMDADVNTVLKLVDDTVSPHDLDSYIALASKKIGHCPKAKMTAKMIGALKIALGMAWFYKTVHHFKDEVKNATGGFFSRYKDMHTFIMDFASVSGFIFSGHFISSGAQDIQPRYKYKSQLLIHLYLKSLVK